MAPAPETLFAHSPLPTPTSIRLIRRHGRDEDGLINISLETCDLADPVRGSAYHEQDRWRPRFHCLSYTWGNPYPYGVGLEDSFYAHDSEYSAENLIEIRCNGKITRIGKNLHDYLCQVPADWLRSVRNRPDPETGTIALHRNVMGDYDIVHRNVANGDNVNAKDHQGRTPLHYAAQNGKIENVRILLKAGALPDVQDADGRTPQDLASEQEHSRLRILLEGVKIENAEGVDSVKSVPSFIENSPDDYVWIDALSIDQSSPEERESQVQMIDQIYASAAYVVVWLGNEDKYIDGALSAVSKLKLADSFNYMESNLVPYLSQGPEEYMALNLPYVTQEEWEALATLFLRQWFKRIWVIQETALANTVVAYCGDKEIDWMGLGNVARLLQVKGRLLGYDPSERFVPLDDPAVSIEYYLYQMEEFSKQVHYIKRGLDPSAVDNFNIFELVLDATPFRATDTRDKIYALMPLAKLGPDEVRIRPDYAVSAAQCYADFTRLQITETGFQVLSYVQDATIKEIDGLPSWVPDFSLLGLVPLFHPEFSASGDLESEEIESKTHGEWNELKIKGIPWESISQTAAPRPKEGGIKKFELDVSWIDLLENIERTPEYLQSHQSFGEVLWRTLCADYDPNNDHPVPEEAGIMFKQFLCAQICTQPEINIREEERQRESTITSFGLPSKALSLREGEHRESGPQGLGIAAMDRLRREMPSPVRSIESKHFDCVRNVAQRFHALTTKYEEPYIPTINDIEQYFQKGATPLLSPSGSNAPDEMKGFALSYSNVYEGRKLFLTQSGYLGLGPASAESGDTVWLLPGFNMPIILRRAEDAVSEESSKEERFIFVGPAYVHGIMHGEAARRFSKKNVREVVLA